MTKEMILSALACKDYNEALERSKYLDAKGHFCGLGKTEKEEWNLLEAYFALLKEEKT